MFFTAFRRLFRREPSPQLHTSDLVRDLGRIESFPTLSHVTVRAMALTNDPKATLADVAELIRHDPVLSVGVLKVANSAANRGRRASENVQQATVRLGMRRCQQVIATVGVRGVFKYTSPLAELMCETLLRHSLFTANIASRLNAAGELGFRGEEFTAGLLHDIGRVIMCVRAPAAFASLDPLTFQEDGGVLARERDAIKFDHCEIGVRFARANQLPATVTNAILNHHYPQAEREFPVLVALAAVADGIANHAQRERKLTNYRPEKCPGFIRLLANVGPEKTRAVRAAVSRAVVDSLRETRAMLKLTATM
ncbi:HDOD domain-containing protein [Gemmata sp. JC717]|uniref:HDOD domain-containing protein n=1 Tax=Gemmata algarum TaxID=2975278 RepID=A0ABU5EXS0_9BACT|nr:HDOD domain-containing protein [Gemmata algarum]MDY3556049.1 HDOD domain-containing protein [Gemmata algarum]MDY3559733.1 HDOD domain-containing protein [Gemmata algarum]